MKKVHEHWNDNADGYICPGCELEVNNPNRLLGCRCPRCGFVDRKDEHNCRNCGNYHAYTNAKLDRGLCTHFMHEMPEDER